MTVAVGLISPIALIVAADSQESMGAGEARSTRKIAVGVLGRGKGPKKERGRIAVAGAGGSDYLAYLKTRIIGRVQALKGPSKFIERVEAVLKEELSDFFQAHFWPAAHIPEYASFEPRLIVAVQFDQARGLWVTRGSTVRLVQWGAEAIGIGAGYADQVLRHDISYQTNEAASARMVSYAIFQAKEQSEYCGKETHLVALRPGPDDVMASADVEAVHRAEEIFRRYNYLKSQTLDYIATPKTFDVTSDNDANLAEMRTELQGIDFFVKRPLIPDLQ